MKPFNSQYLGVIYKNSQLNSLSFVLYDFQANATPENFTVVNFNGGIEYNLQSGGSFIGFNFIQDANNTTFLASINSQNNGLLQKFSLHQHYQLDIQADQFNVGTFPLIFESISQYQARAASSFIIPLSVLSATQQHS